MVTTTTTTATSLSSCTPYQTYVKSEALDFDLTLGSIEKFFDCSGICTKSNFYSLTDISRGPPAQNCVDAINDYVTSYSTSMAGISIAVGILLMLGVVGSMIVVCCLKVEVEDDQDKVYKHEIMESNIIL
ncbi:hypothetical protein FGO68_gene16332 [Halteria grandinella]|uniref:Uncharacterized protein n=1 Tax=Halteria grandinella TaxID=5974 RepID=A0A8J8NMJ8_HALGN|nr:hypothetical protein FGO68_gene16332 [Halteria grandinella]